MASKNYFQGFLPQAEDSVPMTSIPKHILVEQISTGFSSNAVHSNTSTSRKAKKDRKITKGRIIINIPPHGNNTNSTSKNVTRTPLGEVNTNCTMTRSKKQKPIKEEVESSNTINYHQLEKTELTIESGEPKDFEGFEPWDQRPLNDFEGFEPWDQGPFEFRGFEPHQQKPYDFEGFESTVEMLNNSYEGPNNFEGFESFENMFMD